MIFLRIPVQKISWIPFILLCLAGLPVHAQIAHEARDVDLKAQLIEVSKKAQILANQGNLDEAVALLRRQLKDIPPEKANNPYRAFICFNLGYLYRNDGAQSDPEYLSKSMMYYREALKYQPNDSKTLNNLLLVYVETGDENSANEILKEAIRAAPDKEGSYYSAIGDIYSAHGDDAKAWEYYKKAYSAPVPEPDAARKLVDIYDGLPESYADILLEQCSDFDQRGEHVYARLGYAKILANQLSGISNDVYPNSTTAHVLLRWTGISAELGLVTPTIFADAGLDQSQYPPLIELQKYLRAWCGGQFPVQVDNGTSWWQSDPQRHFYLLAYEKGLGDYFMRSKSAQQAAVIYENVLDALWSAKDFSEEIYGKPDALITDVIITLARAYNNPKLGVKDKWGDLESRLFSMKGGSYAVHDLSNMLKFHTVLGQIYFERGEYTGVGAANAEFQLGRAVAVSEEQEKKDPSLYYPIPVLYENLATVLQSQQLNGKAYDALVHAAIGYLETDYLSKAGEVLRKTDALQGSAATADSAQFRIAKEVYQARMLVPTLSKEQLDPNRQEYFMNSATFQWLNEKPKGMASTPAFSTGNVLKHFLTSAHAHCRLVRRRQPHNFLPTHVRR